MNDIREKLINKDKPLVAPSLLSANPLDFGSEMREIENFGADMHHIDVMDGHFVPNLTYGIHFIRPMKGYSSIPLDVHIMVSNPDLVAVKYAQSGADIVTFHIEAAKHPHNLIRRIKEEGGLLRGLL